MLEDWEVDHVVEDNDIGRVIPNQHLRRNRKGFSTPYTARDPNKVDEIELENGDLQGIPNVGAVRRVPPRAGENQHLTCYFDIQYSPMHHLSHDCQRTIPTRRRQMAPSN